MLKRILPTLVAGLALAACADADGPVDLRPVDLRLDPALAIVDGAGDGNPHFYFLPPMVSSPAYSGVFDGAAEPSVTICALSGGACAAETAVFTLDSGPGSETLRMDPQGEHYIANWHTDAFDLDASLTYRITVHAAGQELGFADVDVVDSGKELRNVETGDYIALLDGRTLPIKFRMEEGAIVLNTCETVTFGDPALETGVRAALGIPSGPITETDALSATLLSVRDAGITDLTGLECFTNLVSLNLGGNAIADLAPLAPLTSLQTLLLDGAAQAYPDLAPLAGLTEMSFLKLVHATSFSSIAPLAGMTKLTVLEVLNAPLGGDISALANMNQLRILVLDNVGLTDLGVLAGRTSLEVLRINNNAVADLTTLATLTGLVSFFSHANPVADLSPLAGLTGLQLLFLSRAPVADLAPLAGLTGLTTLNLADNGNITDISPLAPLVNLTTLILRSSPLAGDVSALAGMSQLTNLTAHGVGLNSLAFVQNHPALARLTLVLNDISDATPLLGLAGLISVNLQHNPITCSDPALTTLVANGVAVSCDP